MSRIVNLNNLPKRGTRIDWIKSEGHEVDFIYDDYNGKIKIIKYIDNKNIIIKYKNKKIIIDPASLRYCSISKSILSLKKGNFQIEIGKIFKNNNRDLIIIDRKYKNNIKYYKYRCNNCGYENGWMNEQKIMNNTNCACCCKPPKIIIAGINDVNTTHPHLVKYLKNKEDAFKYSYSSNLKLKFICPDCKTEKTDTLNNITTNKFSCKKCSNSVSYPEKFIFNMLSQLNINFKCQLSKKTFNWCENIRYDFYFIYKNEKYIIEANGKQHYTGGFLPNYEDLKNINKNDKYKKELAIKNGIKPDNYIELNCSYSNLQFIKYNIYKSKLFKILDLDNIDWLICEEYANKNIYKDICDSFNNGNDVNQISKLFKYSKTSIRSILAKGTYLNWCNYNPPCRKKKVEVYKDNKLLFTFPSIKNLEENSLKLFGIKLAHSTISLILNNKRKNLYHEYSFVS